MHTCRGSAFKLTCRDLWYKLAYSPKTPVYIVFLNSLLWRVMPLTSIEVKY